MSAERVSYVDSSAIVKLVVKEPESTALRRYLRRRQLVASALARTEVARAVLSLGEPFARRATEVLARLELVRVSDRVLDEAGKLLPADLRSLDAIHLATARLFGTTLQHVVTYDGRMATAARGMHLRVVSPR